ncbi:MAG TPA: SEC-C domain-containing protein, partial [Actinomycetota bacterium]|nr:SEC-C domain-containing protein [Actinomycetota bacterium]
MKPVTRIAELLDANGPMLGGNLEEALSGQFPGWDYTDFPSKPVDDVLAVHDEVFVRVSWLHGRVFTHRLTEAEADSDLVRTLPDLDIVLNLTTPGGDDWRLTDGTAVLTVIEGEEPEDLEIPEELFDAEIMFSLPSGWLREKGFRAGDLLALRYGPDGWNWEKPTDPGSPDQVVERFWELSANRPVLLDEDVWSLVRETDAFRDPLPPITEIVDAARLEHTPSYAGRPGEKYVEYFTGRTARLLTRAYGLDEAHAHAIALLEFLADDLAEPGAVAHSVLVDSGLPREEVMAALGSNPEFVATWLARMMRLRATGYLAILDWLGEPPRAAAAVVACLRGLALQEQGEFRRAEAEFEKSRRIDPGFRPAMGPLAMFAGLRGDAHGALELHRRSGLEDTDMSRIWQRYVDTTPTARRNDPCPCGSGRKFKQCHLGKTQVPLTDRGFWLSRKMYEFAGMRDPYKLLGLVSVLQDTGMSQAEAMGNPLIYDMVLFEGELLDDFIEEIGPLLPPDELDTAVAWRKWPRSLWEVLEVDPGRGLHLRDVRTGHTIEVVERQGSQSMRVGQYFVTRVAPVGDEYHLHGAVHPVSLVHREMILRAQDDPARDLESLCELYTSYLLPPTIVSGSGEPLTACTALLDPRGDVTVLDDVLELADGDWLDLEGETIRALVRREGEHLRVEAMTTTRFAQCLATIRNALPDAVVLERSEEPVEVPARGSSLRGVVPQPQSLPELSGEETEALAEFVRRHEDRWLDDSIPALSGATPRQAAADPTRRDDL